MKYLSYLLGFGLVALSLSACGGSSAPATSTAAVTSCAAGQVSTTQYGCVASQGSCTIPGTATVGALYNGTCVTINNTATTCSVANQVSTLQYGCVVPTGGSCTVPGTATQGIIYNGNCAQLSTSTTGTVCAVGQVQSQYGCITNTGSCNINGQIGTFYNGACTPITYNTGITNGYNGGVNTGACNQMVDVIIGGTNMGEQCVTYGMCPNGGLLSAQFGCLYPNGGMMMGGGMGGGIGFQIRL